MTAVKKAGTFFLDTAANRTSPAPNRIPMMQAIVMIGDIHLILSLVFFA